MPPAARIGDMHVCPMVTGVVPHVGGPIAKGEPTVMIGFMPAARQTDMCVCTGPPDMIAKGSLTVKIGFLPAARMGDLTVHGGSIVMGCPTVMIGDVGMGRPVTTTGVPATPAPPVHPQCQIHSVELEVEKNLLTLKHDPESKLQIHVSGSNYDVTEYRIEIRRASGGPWCVLARQQTMAPWKAVIAGKFKLRGVIKACGGEHMSPEKDVEVQFPNFAEIKGDPVARAAMDTEWQNTLADCTQNPNRRREKGYWVRLNTATDTYEKTATVNGPFSGPTQGAGVDIGPRPPDNPADPSPCAAGATYSVASFHTHTPTEFRAAATPPGSVRPIGPSGADNTIDTNDDVPGVVYDYVESPAGSGSIPMGHPKSSPAQLYHSRGMERRTTPP